MTALVTAPVARSDRLVKLARWLGGGPVHRMLALDVRGVELVPATGPAIVVANHSGFLDGPVLFAAAPRDGRFLVKAELYAGPLGHLLARIDQVPVNRGRADRTALTAARAALEAGRLVGVFPEGTRGTGDVSQVHDGIGWLVAHTRAPLVPVAIEGTGPRTHHSGRRRRRGITVVFGPPVQLAVLGDPSARATMAAVAEQVRLVLSAHVLAVRLEHSDERDAA
ncbi:MAG: 1-acyl-sn-glycerol-3-phosphate acyltransferase [Frankiales bacterium]|nr:1-acyl-sn-glycerol-3-phosphate acyltransferase [Frankiales bacterium]